MQKEKAKTFAIFLLCVIFLSHSVEKKELVSDLKGEISFLENRLLAIDSLTTRNTILQKNLLALEEKVKKYEDSRYKVTVTMYHPVAAQTDDTPNITADGTVIKIKTASDYNYVAVSRNMLKHYGGFLNYGDYIFLNAGVKSGVYQVRDTMAAHWVNRVDILESPGTPPYKYNNASMRRVSFAMDEDHSS